MSHSTPKIKLCGLRRPEDIAMVNRYRPDYIGFIFWPGSHRRVTAEEAGTLRAQLDPGIRVVGVFLDAPQEDVIKTAERVSLDLIQFHGTEPLEMMASLRSRLGLPVIRACKVDPFGTAGRGDTWRDNLESAASSADYLLLDAGNGEGRPFDWDHLERMVASEHEPDKKSVGEILCTRTFLAGGLTPANVGEAIDRFHPYAVDVSSSLETDGYKDEEKVRAFMEAVRA